MFPRVRRIPDFFSVCAKHSQGILSFEVLKVNPKETRVQWEKFGKFVLPGI